MVASLPMILVSKPPGEIADRSAQKAECGEVRNLLGAQYQCRGNDMMMLSIPRHGRVSSVQFGSRFTLRMKSGGI
jgi:hypothetical protein